MNNFRDLVMKNRSYRRFDENIPIPKNTLISLVELARYCPSSANMQALKFYISSEKPETDKVFSTLKFAGYLKEWEGPVEGERPTAYVVIVGDLRIRKQFANDAGIAAQTIMLGAVEKGYGGCIMAAIQRKDLGEILNLPDYFEILLVLALGVPIENVVIEDVGLDGNIQYYRDSQEVHHVPKRSLDELIL